MNDAVGEPPASGRNRARTRSLRIHIAAYVLANAGLVALNLAMSGYRWFIWPVLGWGALVGIHYLYVKTRNADEEWADRRASRIHDKSYDVGHIDAILDGYNRGERLGRPVVEREEKKR